MTAAASARQILTRLHEVMASRMHAQGKLDLPDPPSRYVPSRLQGSGVTPIPIEHVHALRVAELPFHHRDPFDRLLIAQSQLERAPLLTVDDKLRAYDVELIWAS